MPALRPLFRNSLIAVATTAVLAGCASTTAGSVAGGQRSQLMVVSEAEIVQAAQQAFAQQNAKARAQGALVTSGAEFNRVNTVMRRLVPHVAQFRPDAARWHWELVLINTNELNAHVMPGGKVTVYTGLLRRMGMTDDELAVVIGHEMAHAFREHSREQISQQAVGDLAVSLGGALLGLGSGGTQLAGIAKQVAVDMPYSRNMENEADIYGLELAARAGYNPAAALTLWDKMAAAGAGQGPSFLSSHPSASDRTARIRAALPKLMPIYEAARRR